MFEGNLKFEAKKLSSCVCVCVCVCVQRLSCTILKKEKKRKSQEKKVTCAGSPDGSEHLQVGKSHCDNRDHTSTTSTFMETFSKSVGSFSFVAD